MLVLSTSSSVTEHLIIIAAVSMLARRPNSSLVLDMMCNGSLHSSSTAATPAAWQSHQQWQQ